MQDWFFECNWSDLGAPPVTSPLIFSLPLSSKFSKQTNVKKRAADLKTKSGFTSGPLDCAIIHLQKSNWQPGATDVVLWILECYPSRPPISGIEATLQNFSTIKYPIWNHSDFNQVNYVLCLFLHYVALLSGYYHLSLWCLSVVYSLILTDNKL